MSLKVFNPRKRQVSFFRINSDYPFRDNLFVSGGRSGSIVFLNSALNNPYRHYKVITLPVANGSYKVRVASEDAYGNTNVPGTDPEAYGVIVVGVFVLPPIDIKFTVSGNNVTFTWEHPSSGAPDAYIFYGGRDGAAIDRTTPIGTAAGSAKTKTLTLASGVWKIVIEAKINCDQWDIALGAPSAMNRVDVGDSNLTGAQATVTDGVDRGNNSALWVFS